MTDKIPVIFDSDPGVDDAMALFYALAHPAIDLIGITTTFGNVTAHQATANAIYLTQLTGHPTPVAQGRGHPLVKPIEAPPAFIHCDDGLGNLPARLALKPEEVARVDKRAAAQFIVDQARARPGEITLAPVGPLTNIADALTLEPDLPKLIKRVVLMGGAAREPGNVSPVAEANIWNDPHAADAVFTAGFDCTMVGLDVTYKVVVPGALVDRLASKHRHIAFDTLQHATRFYAQFYETRFPEVGAVQGCFGHDVLALIALTRPDLFKTATGAVRVVTEGIAQGQTIFNERTDIDFPQHGFARDLPLSQACIQVNASAVLQELEETLALSWLHS
jgi:purine nucleosidase